jgi:hypothetical protein
MVKAAFRATGVFPFNPEIITAAQMKPAEATSTHAAFPLQQSSPVQVVMAAFHHYQRFSRWPSSLMKILTPSRGRVVALQGQATVDTPANLEVQVSQLHQ